MHNTGVETDVLIVGAGPVGLFLANECARRGLKWRLLEARSTQSEDSKALAIFPRTLEIFDMAGVVNPFLETANRVTSVAVATHERALAHMRFAPEDSPYPFIAMVPQDVTERLLVEQLGCKGGTVEYETSFVSAVQHDDFVTATLDQKGGTRRRVVATVEKAEGDAPPLDFVQKILGQRVPIGIEAHVLHWSSYFRIHHRHVAQLRRGRVFVAGDAAHIHSPFGGQGMNTGLHDVWNLIWKLDLFLHGRGNEQLLDSYSAERIPVIKNVIETTHFLTKAMGTPNKFAQAYFIFLFTSLLHTSESDHLISVTCFLEKLS